MVLVIYPFFYEEIILFSIHKYSKTNKDHKFSLRDSNSNLDIQNVSSCQLDERKIELCTGIEPIYPDYKSGASPTMLTEL